MKASSALLVLVCALAPHLSDCGSAFADVSGTNARSPATGAADGGRLTPVVGSITILGNRRTDEAVIRRELLFRVGSRLDSNLVEESARNLRLLLFLANVEITIHSQKAGQIRGGPRNDPIGSTSVVDVVVQVEDLYSRALSPLVSGTAQELSYGFAALDYNFLGRGHTARLTLERDAVSGHHGSISYRVRRLRQSPFVVDTDLGLGAEGHHAVLRISRPFSSLATARSFGVTTSSSEAIQRLYAAGRQTARYKRTYRGAGAWYAHSLGDQVKFRPGVRISISEHEFDASRGYAYTPDDSRRVRPSVSALVWRPQYERTRWLNALGTVEDVQLGSWISVVGGASLRALGSDRDYPFVSLQVAPRTRYGSDTYAFAFFAISSRYHDGKYRQVVSTCQLRLHRRIGAIHGLAARLRLDTVDRPETQAQFLLGVDGGLRGYWPRSWEGRRRLLANVEVRPTLRQRPDYVVAGAVFVDAGAAWSPGESSPSARPALGLGLRVGLPRVYSTPVMRVDIARGLRRGVWQLSFGIGQYF